MQNILIIMGDQHRAECIGSYGNKDIRTPHLDALARDGVRYTQHYTTYPVCTPSRYSFLSGLYAHQHGGWDNHCTLASGFDTFPKVLVQSGYHTVAVGKMHMTPTYLEVGFQKMILAEQDGDGRFEDDYHLYLKDRNLLDENDIQDQRQEYREKAGQSYWDTFGAIKSNLPERHHSTAWITDRALEELDMWGAEGNMLFVSYIKPHHPFDPPAPYDTMYDPETLQLLPGYTESVSDLDYEHSHGYFDHKNLTPDKLKRIMAHYYGSISHMDYHIGRIIDALKQKGLYENTLILYTSDHGDYMGYHHMLLKSNYMYDPLVRIPLIVKYPGGERAGEVNDAISNNLDIAPTILHQAGVRIPQNMKGLDLRNPKAERKMTICEGLRTDHYSTGKANYYEYMVRSRRYKLIINKNLDHWLFFDLEKDPLESEDVSGNPVYREILLRHRDYLLQTLVFDAPAGVYLNEEEKSILNKGTQKECVRDYCRIYFEQRGEK